ncbi:MAG: C40 family peptidase [Bacillota bacterium]
MFKRILAVLLLLLLMATVVPSIDQASASGTPYYVKINNGTLNMRKTASTKSGIVTKLAKGTTVTVHSQANGWAKVTANKKQGFVSSNYIAPKKAVTTKPTATKNTATGQPTDYRTKAISVAKSNKGVKYKWGGTTPAGFDCSGLVSYAYKQAGITLPRTAAEMYKKGTTVKALAPGDLVFYATSGGKKVTHVAIYIGDGQVIHSTTSVGVSITSMNNSYWKARYVGAKRI